MITSEQFTEKWLLLPGGRPLLSNRTAHGRIGMALFLKFFQEKGHFPAKREDIQKEAVNYMALQIRVSPDAWHDLAWEGPAIKRLRAEIRQWLGFREATVAHAEAAHTRCESPCSIHIKSAAWPKLAMQGGCLALPFPQYRQRLGIMIEQNQGAANSPAR